MSKYEIKKMNELELENVAGGQTFWYTRIHGSWTDPVTGKNFADGYLVRGKDIETGEKTTSYWVIASEWDDWKATMEWRGHSFIEGDSNPDGCDSLAPKA